MIVGVLQEAGVGESRVAATPSTVGVLLGLGYQVVVEPGAGLRAGFADQAYLDAGAGIAGVSGIAGVGTADVVLGVNTPTAAQLDGLKVGAVVVGMLSPRVVPGVVEGFAARPLTALSLDVVPRISRAQSLDVLSSMANVAGYRAVVEAAHVFGRFFTGQVTAAGKVPPAKVLVVGAGVAGLAAIGAAGSLGAVVRATDPRPEVADQVASLGGEYLSVAPVDESAGSGTGYAQEMGDDYKAREARLYAEQAREVDIIITTALIPGRAAPRIITAEMVASMRAGSVIVDMAAANGGNVEGTVPGEVVVTGNGVTIIGYTDLAGRLAAQSSQLYGTNLVNLLKLMTPGKDGELVLDLDDVVQRGITVTRFSDGVTEVLWPPPDVQVSATPATQSPGQGAGQAQGQAPGLAPGRVQGQASGQAGAGGLSAGARMGLVFVGVGLFGLVNAVAPTDELRTHFTVLMLSVVVGFYVIGKVHHALHTPLMSVTNAISGVVVVGALLQLVTVDPVVRVLAAVGVLLAAINIFGGFAVTRRMLVMFSKEA